MPFYRIRVWTRKKGEAYEGIRYAEESMEVAYEKFERLIHQTYRTEMITKYEIVMMSEKSREVKSYLMQHLNRG